MPNSATSFSGLDQSLFEHGQALRRRLWLPLRRLTELFHPVPVAAVVAVTILLAWNGQLREIYLSYLEDLEAAPDWSGTMIHFAAAAALLTLLSAALYEVHYRLSTMRINVIYSSLSNPDVGSRLRALQRTAAFAFALAPWLGVAGGLVHAEFYLADRHDRLGEIGINVYKHVPAVSAWTVVPFLILLGLAISLFLVRYRYHSLVRNGAVVGTTIAAVALFLLLTDRTWQTSNLVSPDAGLGAALIVYYAMYFWLFRIRTRSRNFRGYRQFVLFGWALCPWIAIAFSAGTSPQVSPRAIIVLAMACVLVIGLLVAIALDKFRERTFLWGLILVITGSLLGVAILAAWHGTEDVITLYQWIGPLGSVALGVQFVFCTFAILALLSQRSGFPALSLVIAAIIIGAVFPDSIKYTAIGLAGLCGFLSLTALVSRLGAVAIVAAVLTVLGIIAYFQQPAVIAKDKATGGDAIEARFNEWIKKRPQTVDPSSSTKSPVFIIAVEGGGIYAAAAAALFLARLEDCNPGFSQHVFAISGVSGGAVGATIFQALQRSAASSLPNTASDPIRPDGQSVADARKCRTDEVSASSEGRQKLEPILSKVILADHLSPVVGALFPELLSAPTRREQVLAESFTKSVGAADKAAAQALRSPYAGHWTEDARTPALVLNATWVETGFRVAFAPFPLHDSDKSLFSFLDPGMPALPGQLLMDAAVVSARFPAILPPYSVSTKGDLWNFVDGGYSDNSGASTALALYHAIKKSATAHQVSVRVILLTSANPEPELNQERTSFSGTTFRDTLAPIIALLKVREGLGNQAVARACDAFRDDNNCENKTETDKALTIIEIEDQTYGLPLGWKLSHSTLDLVAWMLGEPAGCERAALAELELKIKREREMKKKAVPNRETKKTAPDREINKKTVLSNSCALESINELMNKSRGR